MAARRTVRDLRRDNRTAVLRQLYFGGTTSRLEVARLTGLSPATVGTVVGELLHEGVVEETGQMESEGGRPATLLDIRRDRAFAIGVDVGETGVRAELFDLRLQTQRATVRTMSATDPSPAEVVRVLKGAVDYLKGDIPAGVQLLGVGVGVPGIVDDHDHTVVYVPSIGWDGVPLHAMLLDALGGRVWIDNGAKTMGRAEAWFGEGREVSNLVVTLIGTGVGAALISDGTIYRGATSSAGEWGHTKIVVGGAACRCGAKGCLEAYIGADAIVARYRRFNRSVPAGLGQVAALQHLADALKQGRAPAQKTLEETATYLAVGIGNLTNMLNPAKIVLGGYVGLLLGPVLLPLVRERLADYALRPAADRVVLALSAFGPDAVALGAATLPVEHFLRTGGRTLSAHDDGTELSNLSAS